MAITCPKCQTENSDTARFCADCGIRLGPPSEATPQVSVTKTMETPWEILGRGTVLAGRFEVIEELGAGGMGRVFRAFDKEIGEEVAIKILHSNIALDRRTVDRFRNEIKLSRKISHRSVCRMHELHLEGRQLFITMEYVSGQDLKDLIRQAGALTSGKAVSLAKQVAEGLAEAHGLGVVHRDLKPQNIMIDREGYAKIMDFGIARSLYGSSMTAEGTLVGTPDYMSPEQVEGQEADQRSDIYALGVILYEMITGRLPFEGDTPLSVAYKHKNEFPISPRKLNSHVPELLNRLILCCLEKKRENRYQKVGDLLADLLRIEEGIPISERVILKSRPTDLSTAARPSRLNRFLIPALVGVGAIVALVLWLFLPRKRPAPAPRIPDSIAVLDFENLTGDKSYDYLQKTIADIIISLGLRDTGYFDYIIGRKQMLEYLKQIGKGDVKVIDRDSGFTVCSQAGIKLIALGSFARSGETFVLDVKILDVNNKRQLTSAHAEGEGEKSLLKVGRALSQQIGDSLKSQNESWQLLNKMKGGSSDNRPPLK